MRTLLLIVVFILFAHVGSGAPENRACRCWRQTTL